MAELIREMKGEVFTLMICVLSRPMLAMMINTCQTWEWKGEDATQRWQSQNYVFPHEHKMRENNHEKITATMFDKCHSTLYPCTQTTPTPLTSLIITHFISHTPTRGKAIWLSRSPTRPYGEYKSCCVIHPRKVKQSPLSCPRRLLFPPLWQAPLQPHHMQLTSWSAWPLEIMCPPTLPPLPPLHIRWDTT